MANTKKYEVIHPIRISRNELVPTGRILELDAQQAHEWAHAVRLLPEDAQKEQEAAGSPEEAAAESQPGGTQAQEDGGGEGEEAPDELDTEDAAFEQGEGKPKVTPAAQEEAQRLGISLEHVEASGLGNTLTKKDVQKEAKRIRDEREEAEQQEQQANEQEEEDQE